MRLTLTEAASDEVREQQLSRLNEIFASLYEAWLLMGPEARQAFNERYLRAQSEYHFIGSAMLNQIRPPVVFHPSLMMSPPPSAADIVFNPNNHPPASSPNDNPSANSSNGNNEANTVSATDKASEQEMHEQPQMFTREQLNAAVESAAEQALWPNINFEAYTKMVQPIFDLPAIEELSNSAIDAIIEAIERVMKEAEMLGTELNQHTERALILHIVSTLDRATKRCWRHRAKNSEPTFDYFIDFLMDERSDEPVQKKFIIPRKVAQPAPVVADSPNEPTPGPSGEQAKKKKKKGSRSNTPNRGDNQQQCARPNAQPTVQPAVQPSAQQPVVQPNAQQPVVQPSAQQPVVQPVVESVQQSATSHRRPARTPAKCPMCNQPHGLRECSQFMSRTLEDREAILHRNGWCINCLSTTHTVRMCMSGPCKICNKRHNSILHHR